MTQQSPYPFPGIGYQQPYFGSGSAPFYENGGSYQTFQNSPFSGDTFHSGGNRGMSYGFDNGRSDNVSLTPPPVNIPQVPQETKPQLGQSSYNYEIALTEMNLAPEFASIKDATEVSPGKEELESVSGTGYEITVNHEVEQQQNLQEKHQPYGRFSSAEKDQANTDIIDYGNGAATSGNEISQLPQKKYEQPEPEVGYGGAAFNANNNVAFDNVANVASSSQPAKIAAAPIVSESTKTSVKSDDHEKNTIFGSRDIEMDDSACNDPILKSIVELTLNEYGDNLDAARNIESEASKRFGGRFNSIVSDSEFAYVNWYGKRNCQLEINGRHSLTWED
ncbi:ground-like domain protein [Onchocerca flexuosa]|uniref:Ground-like domain protein n=1 Tax=Onchocerca flexuosa TaxID=387005 RepID=A0A238BR62_9BILA|nr:ground-like domain protein [Onchocerca flexuosa]